MAKIDLKNPGRTIHAGVILMGGITEILDVAPIDLLHSLSPEIINHMSYPDELKKQTVDIEFHWVNEYKTPAKLTAGITIMPTDSFTTCPALDIVVMGAHWDHVPNNAELAFVSKVYEDCSTYLSICGGMLVPLAAGVLAGKTCTAPLSIIGKLRKGHPEVHWVERRYVKDSDGRTWTSGTLLNGLDLMKAFVEETWGGPGTLAEALVKNGGWPLRHVEYEG